MSYDTTQFSPTLGELDLHLFGEGRHEQLWKVLGARAVTHHGEPGVAFAVWAPAARSLAVEGDFNGWDRSSHPLRRLADSGVWEAFVPGATVAQRYKFVVVAADGVARERADPMARAAEVPPATASVVAASDHRWADEEWMRDRPLVQALDRPLSVYEVHVGSWRFGDDGRSLGYRQAAEQLADWCQRLGSTHVELLPVAEHPFGGSWGYQVTSFYAPTARYGSPDDFRAFVDTLHQAGLGVIIDWVPAHFPRDEWALARFDGTPLYEHADPLRASHPDWGTLEFDYRRNEVRNFLTANALYWVEEFHVDGLRVDAVASMLYLDYSRGPGAWRPNERGGNEDLDAIAFLQECNTLVHRLHPGVLTVAEESTAWPQVSRPVDVGGLGFTHKWNMGWMHDTLGYFARDPLYRQYHQHELAFGLTYAHSENFVLPLSHDEVVHGKGSLVNKMPGDEWQRLANLRALYAWMWAHPGKQLLFMGDELAQEREWNHDRPIDWELLDDPARAGLTRLVSELNRVQRAEPALWAGDFEPAGFRWVAADDTAQSVLSFLRVDPGGSRVVLCVAHFGVTPLHDYRIGVTSAGRWEVLLNTDDPRWGGSGGAAGPSVGIDTEAEPWHGFEQSVVLSLPPLAVCWLAPV